MSNTNCNCNCPPNDYLPPCPDIPLPPPRPLPPCPPRPGCTPGCSDQTPNYGLPLWKASDVTSWLMQINGAMLRIDTIMHDLALRTGINGLPDDLVSTVSKLNQDVEVLKCSIADLSNKSANTELIVQNMNTQVAAIKTDLSSITINLTNLDTRLMTVDTKTEGIENRVTLMRSDVNMIQQSVDNLQSNMLAFQNATNQSLLEHTASLRALTECKKTIIQSTSPEVTYTNMQPAAGSEDDLEQIFKKSVLTMLVDTATGLPEHIVFRLSFALTSPFEILNVESTTSFTTTLKFTGEFPLTKLITIQSRGVSVMSYGNAVALISVPFNIGFAKDGNTITVNITWQNGPIRRVGAAMNQFKTYEGFGASAIAYTESTKVAIIPEPNTTDEGVA